MEPRFSSKSMTSFKGRAGLVVAVAGILYLWHRFRPIQETDIENKKPLGLG
jgi:hypothetical protein